MYAGQAAERAGVHDIYREPAHPYTRALLGSIPRVDQKGQKLTTIEGLPPNLINTPPGCPFEPRCEFSRDLCKTDNPQLRIVEGHGSSARDAACHYFEEVLEA
jgi:oligopeptide/dipeptide ABC transporter ATP-binding protein